MKLAAFLMLAFLLLASIIVDAQTVNLSGKNLSLKKIFATIKKQTGTLFFYDEALIKEAKPLTVNLKNATLETALNEVFKDQPFTWALEDKTVTITRNPGELNASTPVTQYSSFPVKGTITDTDGNPVGDASITIKGNRRGAIADRNGRFSVNAGQNDILVFSSVSHAPKEVIVDKGEMNIQLLPEFRPMEALVVGGNISVIKRKAEATSVTVIDSKTLERIPTNTIDQIFRGWVPGTNSFDIGDAPQGFPSLSIRGAASQTSLSQIAVYIDGIEYAGGSGYLCQLDKSNIDHIEILRGPGASTLYGTGSNGGIVQIFTKKGKLNQTAVNFTSSAGFYKSKWVDKNAFQQLHNLELVTGFKKASLTIGGTYRTVGAYLPGGGEKNKGFYMNGRVDLGKLQVNLTGRYNARNFSLSRNPLYDTAIHPRADIFLPGNTTTPAYLVFNVRPTASQNKDGLTETYIAGINLSHNTTRNWVNKLDAGYTSNSSTEVPVADGVTPLQNQYISDKFNTTTLRYYNILTLGNGAGFNTTLLSGIEYKKYSSARSVTRTTNATLTENPDNENYGAFVQLNPSYKNVYLTMGLRYEKNELFKAAWNPRIGLTTNFDLGRTIFKPRISWGKGITPPTYTNRFGRPANAFSVTLANPEIRPQSQQGFDYGLEIYDEKGRYKFEVVYYDNILKDMIAEVTYFPTPGNPLYTNSSINAGQVVNRGWEFSGEYRIKRFSLQGTFSMMNALVEDTAGSYLITQLKGKAPGTRLSNLPKHTAGLNLSYNFFKLFGKTDKGSVALNVTEVDGIKSLDSKNYLLDVAYGRTVYTPGVFAYPIESSAVFRVGFYADYQIIPELSFFAQGSNILNDYHYEYSSDYPTHGATWLFGFKYSFVKNNN